MMAAATQSPPIDRAARDRLADAIVGYMRGEIDNFQLDEAALPGKWTDDPSVREIGSSLWFVYDDLTRHSVHASPELWDALRRTIAFLRSDLVLKPTGAKARVVWWKPLVGVLSLATMVAAVLLTVTRSPWWALLPGVLIGIPWLATTIVPSHDVDSDSYFPFHNEKQWREHEPLLEREHLPSYDPALHDQPVRGRLASSILYVPSLVLGAVVIVPLMALFLLHPRFWIPRRKLTA